MKSIHILVGEGIECEAESERLFRRPDVHLNVQTTRLRIQDLVQKKSLAWQKLLSGDWVFVPGGFSFADHFGSGKLLAFELRKAGFFEACFERGVNLMGVCNGFQVLAEAGFFGRGVSLEPNHQAGGRAPGFINRWVYCEGMDFLGTEPYYLPVRHGEGRVQREGAEWDAQVRPFLKYIDPEFENGSVEGVAGLRAERGRSKIIGLMPHPEIAVRLIEQPDTLATEWPWERRRLLGEPGADGLRLVRQIMEWAGTTTEGVSHA